MNVIDNFSPYSLIIFDLDGTLVDSSSSILNSLRVAMKKAGIDCKDLDDSLIGPPINEILLKLNVDKKEVREEIIKYFRETYDENPVKGAKVYTPIYNILPSLSTKKLCIATNKPEVPTQRILRHFGLTQYFSLVYCSNTSGASWTKSQMVESILKKFDVDKSQCLMVGDTKSDYFAAASNQINFAFVRWGYSPEKKYLSEQASFTMD